MTGMQYMNDLNTANITRQLWEKLPRYLRSKWTERVSRIKSVKGQTASFNNFCQFVSEQADLATDPIYSEEGISKPMDAVERYHKQNERKTKRGRGTTSQHACQEGKAVEETLTPSAVHCAVRRITWTNVLSFLKNR